MSKMRMPEMDVVRFQESDVIVASSNSISLNLFGDGVNGNGYVTYLGQNYGNLQTAGDLSSFYSAFNKDHGTSIGGTTNIGYKGGMTNFDGLQSIDNTTSTSGIDGPYVWNGNEFAKQ